MHLFVLQPEAEMVVASCAAVVIGVAMAGYLINTVIGSKFLHFKAQ